MSGTSSNDVLMFFEVTKGNPIAAESQSALLSSTGLMEGFVAGKYFEAENFAFTMELHDDESGGGGASGAGASGGGAGGGAQDSRSYARWRVLKDNEPKPDPVFKAEPSDASITRLIDASSPILLKHCLDTKRFHRAVLVKRVRIGQTGKLAAVFRLEFSDVWLKAIEWEDGDTVRESLKFKFSAVRAVYVRREADGSLAGPAEYKWTSPQVPPTS